MVSNYNSIECEAPKKERKKVDIHYGITDSPPWALCVFLAFQQFLMTFETTFAYPIMIQDAICIEGDDVGLARLVNTCGFVSGIATLLQITFGIRLPVIQASTGIFLTPISIVMNLDPSNCPYNYPELFNSSQLPERGSDGHKEIWEGNIQELSGSLMVAALLSVVVGSTGVISWLIKYIGPLTVAPTLLLLCLSLASEAEDKANLQWYIAFMTIFLVTVFSQYMRHVSVSIPGLPLKIKIFELYSLLLALAVAWLICLVLTVTGVLPDNPGDWGYEARTDCDTDVLQVADWFYVPYPGQFGMPKVTLPATIGLMTATLACWVESIGTYYATARICNAPSPPPSAVNRGILTEGISSLLNGLWGTGGGTVTYASNVAAIDITKVGSRTVTQVAAGLLIAFGCFGKFGALFTTIPDPVIGGIFYIIFGMVGGVGISNLQFVDLSNSRNLFIFGVSVLVGFSLPGWIAENQDAIKTGNDDIDSVIIVLGSTSMLMGGILAFVLDNTIPGTPEERGILLWKAEDETSTEDKSIYNVAFIQDWIKRKRLLRYIPFCPGSYADKTSVDEGESSDQDMSILDNGCVEHKK